MAVAIGLTRPKSPTTIVVHVNCVTPDMFDTGVVIAEELPASSHAPHMTIAVPFA